MIDIEKECNLNTVSAEELLISKYMKAVTDKKPPGQDDEKNTLELKKKRSKYSNEKPTKRKTRKIQTRKH